MKCQQITLPTQLILAVYIYKKTAWFARLYIANSNGYSYAFSEASLSPYTEPLNHH